MRSSTLLGDTPGFLAVGYGVERWGVPAPGARAWMGERAGYVTSLGRKPRRGCHDNRYGFRIKTRVARVSWHNAAATSSQTSLNEGPGEKRIHPCTGDGRRHPHHSHPVPVS